MGRVSTLVFFLGAPGGGFRATVSLHTGEGEADWRGDPNDEWAPAERRIQRHLHLETFDNEALARLRAHAETMRARGDFEYRDQFAQATITMVLEEGDSRIEWAYHLDGGLPVDEDAVFGLVQRRVWGALAAQRDAERARGPLLPNVQTEAQLMEIHRATEPWMTATLEVANRHRCQSDSWSRASDGSQIVMIGDSAIIKFYVPWWPSTVDVEMDALKLVRYELDFEVPAVKGRGSLDGWEYLVVSKVAGTPLRDVELTDEESLDLADKLGEAIRALHGIPVPKDSPLREVVPKWRAFLSDHRKRRRELELQRGTPGEWADRLVEHLRSWRYRKRPTNALLHADLTDDHIMLEQVDGRWAFHGIIDFGDVKVGDPAYEFAAPFACWTADRPELRRRLLKAYGAGDELLDRIFESLLLHEFGRLAALNLESLACIDDLRKRYIDL